MLLTIVLIGVAELAWTYSHTASKERLDPPILKD